MGSMKRSSASVIYSLQETPREGKRSRQKPRRGPGERIAHAFPYARDAAFRPQILCHAPQGGKESSRAGDCSPLHMGPERGRCHASPPPVTDNGCEGVRDCVCPSAIKRCTANRHREATDNPVRSAIALSPSMTSGGTSKLARSRKRPSSRRLYAIIVPYELTHSTVLTWRSSGRPRSRTS